MSKIQFGKRNEEIISVLDLEDFEALDKCNCTCPDCGYPLIACSMNGKQIRHFRHKSGYQHCHFHLDDYLMDFIFNTISKIDYLPELDESDFDRFIVSSKHVSTKNKIINSSPNKRSFKVLERIGQKVKVEIEGETYFLKFVFKKRKNAEDGDKSIAINLSDLINNELISKEDSDRINDLALSRINKAIRKKSFEQNNFFENDIETNAGEFSKSDIIVKSFTRDYSSDKSNSHIVKKVENPNFASDQIFHGKCPRCETGRTEKRTNHITGQNFFGCSSFFSNEKCRFYAKEYYDYGLKKWMFSEK